MSRNLKDVITNILNEIPDSEVDLISQLKDNRDSVTFSAPEMLPLWWGEVQSSLLSYLPEVPNEEWQFKILSIFSTKSVNELKSIFEGVR